MSEHRTARPIFPDVKYVDGIEGHNFRLVPINEKHNKYNMYFQVKHRDGFSKERPPAFFINEMLECYRLPDASTLLSRHPWHKAYQNGKEVPPLLPYNCGGADIGFISVEVERWEFEQYYHDITSAPYVLDNFKNICWEWLWRHLDQPSDITAFHVPDPSRIPDNDYYYYELPAPINVDDLNEIVHAAFPDYKPGEYLQLRLAIFGLSSVYVFEDTDDANLGPIIKLDKDLYTIEDDDEYGGRRYSTMDPRYRYPGYYTSNPMIHNVYN